MVQYLSTINAPKITKELLSEFDRLLSENGFLQALNNMPTDKSPGNDGLSKGFYQFFWHDIKIPLKSDNTEFLTKTHNNTPY